MAQMKNLEVDNMYSALDKDGFELSYGCESDMLDFFQHNEECEDIIPRRTLVDQFLRRNAVLRSGGNSDTDTEKRWSWEGQMWLSPSAAASVDGACLSDEETEELYDLAWDYVRQSIALCGVGVITDSYFAVDFAAGEFHVLKCEDKDEDDVPYEWYEVFDNEGKMQKALSSGDGSVKISRFTIA